MTSKEYSLKKNDLGAIGIGAMIIFIALILVTVIIYLFLGKIGNRLKCLF